MELKALKLRQSKKLDSLPKEVKLTSIRDVILCVPYELLTKLIHKGWNIDILMENVISFYKMRVEECNEQFYIT